MTSFISSKLVDTAVVQSADKEDVAYPRPLNEDARLSALHELEILDTPADDRFDRIVRLAKTHFDTPIVRITFVDSDRVWFKSCVGMNSTQAPRKIAICSQAIMSNEVLVSCDLASDPAFQTSPQVVGDPKLRFYAGAPITMEGDLRVGSLCIIDFKTRPEFSKEDREFLADLAETVVHELTLHKQIVSRDKSLMQAEELIKVARDAKKRFIDIVGHELKTPLSHVVGFGKILADQSLGPLGNDNYADYALCLHQSAEHLEGLIDRILNYSSAEAGELKLAETTVATEAIMAKSLDMVQLSGKRAGVDFELSLDPQTPANIHVDEVQIAEVMLEILRNAISFSPSGTIIELNASCNKEGGVCIRVLDRGPGIEESQIERIMSAFRQGNESLSRDHEGMGLGLPVACALIELHGGTLNVSNRPGGGLIAQASLPSSRNREE